jgi:signal transduction histidine kinase
MPARGGGSARAPAGRILVLHDSHERGQTLARMLRVGGHTVTVVGQGADAAAALVTTRPHVLLASPYFEDPPLPELVQGARAALGYDLLVLVVAGRDDLTLLDLADDVVLEPVDPRVLSLRVASMLRQRFAREALQRRVEELQALYRVSWAFSLAAGPEAFFGQLSRHSAGLVKAAKATVVLYDPQRREMAAQAPGHGLTPQQVAMVRYPVAGDARERWNFRTNGPLVANQARTDARLLPGLAVALDVRSALVVALPRGPEIIGMLAVGDREDGRPFDDADLSMLQTIAAQASIAVENFHLHQRLKQANRQLVDLDRLKNDFVAMVAHDFRGPLMAIRGYAEVVGEDPDLPPERIREFMRTIVDQTDDLARLASDTFLITQMEEGQFEYRWSEIDLGPFILDALARMHTDRAITIDVPPRFPRITVDPERLRQVLTNLLTNAIKYSQESTGITVRARERAPDHVLIEIVDQGLGIPADQIGRLFQKFERVRSEAHDRVSGTGLGLYICRLIVEGHGGRIWAQSAGADGSTFLVLLPVIPPRAAAASPDQGVRAAENAAAVPEPDAQSGGLPPDRSRA